MDLEKVMVPEML